jgi:hypothetical protein
VVGAMRTRVDVDERLLADLLLILRTRKRRSGDCDVAWQDLILSPAPLGLKQKKVFVK